MLVRSEISYINLNILVCEENQLPYMTVIRSFKRSKKWSDCRDACNDDNECEYFKWKVMDKSSLLLIHYPSSNNFVFTERQEVAEKNLLPNEDQLQS